jgi:hypothetical protein
MEEADEKRLKEPSREESSPGLKMFPASLKGYEAAHIFVDNRERFGIRKADSEKGLRFTLGVRRMLLVVTVINQEHADDACGSLSLLNIFSSTWPRCSGAISGEAPMPDPPLNPSRGPSPGARFVYLATIPRLSHTGC